MTESSLPVQRLPRDEYLATLPKATVYACLYFTDIEGRPVLLRATYTRTDTWQCPGGNLDQGESPWQAAVRETREETGITITGSRPLLLTHYVTPDESWPCGHVGFIFDGGTLTPERLDGIVLDPSEHSEWSVRALEEWRTVMPARAFERLAALDAARHSGRARYLEHDRHG